MLRLIVSLPRTDLWRALELALPPQVGADAVEPEALLSRLDAFRYSGALVQLDRGLLRLWPLVRHQLISQSIPTILLAPLSADVLHACAFDRQLCVVALHVVGIEDSLPSLRRSLETLVNATVLRRLVRHFGPSALALEELILPIWDSLSEIRTIEQWAALRWDDAASLGETLRSLGVRSPRRLVTWLRLLSAWPQLQAGVPVGRVALSVGYSAPPAFTRSARQFLGVSPSEAPTVSVDVLIDRAVADLVA